MIAKNQIYKCSICGNVVEVLTAGGGELVCCGKPMELMAEKTKDEGQEKHVPIIEPLPANVYQGKDGFKIKVGEVPHPMEEKHFIEWIEIKTKDGKIGKKFLKPGGNPESDFYTRMDILEARAYCNVHGLWKKNN